MKHFDVSVLNFTFSNIENEFRLSFPQQAIWFSSKEWET